MRTRLRQIEDQLHKYKEKAQSFYKQLTFASWARDSGFHLGYMERIDLSDVGLEPWKFLQSGWCRR
jgi:hypothetical protein